ncbi:MAG: hypothetical protein IKX18_06580, partial [Muribaculaceae bacterium]|nr:hypothetical protein [Muribaculaceae bacterium]
SPWNNNDYDTQVDRDSDGDGTLDSEDECPSDPAKTKPGIFELHNTFPTLFHEKMLYSPGALPRDRFVPLWHYALGHRPHVFPSTDDEICGVKKNKVVCVCCGYQNNSRTKTDQHPTRRYSCIFMICAHMGSDY